MYCRYFPSTPIHNSSVYLSAKFQSVYATLRMLWLLIIKYNVGSPGRLVASVCGALIFIVGSITL